MPRRAFVAFEILALAAADITLLIRRSTAFGTLNRLSCPFALTGEIRRGFFKTHEKLCGNHPKPALLFLIRFASSLVYGLTSAKMATPTKAIVMSFSGFRPTCLGIGRASCRDSL